MEEAYRNKVFHKDVLKVLRGMPDHALDMIYGDPDYNVGINYAGKTYTKKWEAYMQWYIRLTRECMRVLKPSGNLFMMNYPKQNAHLRVKYLDEHAYAVHEYVWVYNTNIGHSPKKFTTAHRSILHATKTARNNFYKDQVAQPYQNPTDRRIRERIKNGHKGRMPYSWFEFNLVKNVSKDKTYHACQVPLGLVALLIKSSTKENDDVAILFGGSGAELLLCRELKRNFVSCEVHAGYYAMITDRLRHHGDMDDKYRLAAFKKKAVHALSS